MTTEPSPPKLSVVDHDRDVEGYRYVYPVVSRRAAGVSVGVNLNPNNACNFRCVYCQVPDLVAGKGPSIDLAQLEHELADMLGRILHGDYLETRVDAGSRRLNDIALSGNGEPTSSPQFQQAIDVIAKVRATLSVSASVSTVLITNGTLCHQQSVLAGIHKLGTLSGKVWFKLDSATAEGMWKINSTRLSPAAQREKLVATAVECDTWLQTCVFARNGAAPSEHEQNAYLDLVRGLVAESVPVKGVLLYGLARQSHQPEAPELAALPHEWLEDFAQRIRQAGLDATVSV